MVNILNFQKFEESYLKGGRQPMCHFLSYGIVDILNSDMFKMKNTAVRKSRGRNYSNSWTRNIDFTNDGGNDQFIIEVDADKLRNDGIRFHPVDELSLPVARKAKHLGKSNFSKIKSGVRWTKHGLDLPMGGLETPSLELEFEERTYKDIKNLGRYIISIMIDRDSLSKFDSISYYSNIKDVISNYLKRYPHIRIKSFDQKNRRIQSDITHIFDKELELTK